MSRGRIVKHLFLACLFISQTLLAHQAILAQQVASDPPAMSEAVFAGGCFWSMESAFSHCPGVHDVVSGYSGGHSKQPTYETYQAGGHREVIWVQYDSSKVTYRGLVEFFLKHIDPLDRAGSFIDRGKNYSSAIYCADEEEAKLAKEVIQEIDRLRVFKKPITVPILPRQEFYPAEAYHQNYQATHPVEYAKYRATAGRDEYLLQVWGPAMDQLTLPGSLPTVATDENRLREVRADNVRPWESFRKPPASELKKRLTKIQYRVTQASHTELAFSNPYWNHHEEGLYVDVVSGEPLFCSRDKFDSGTGWPSFVKPIASEYVESHEDRSDGTYRIEVRSAIAKSHLGHVFTDGPRERGGLRFCINSASLRFIAKSELEKEGYSEFLPLFP